MNDPHVVALSYRISHGEGVDYDNAKTLEVETEDFKATLEPGKATVEMKTHYATTEKAREKVDPVLRAWEISAGLDKQPNELCFDFEKAEVVDRDPPPGVGIHAEPGSILMVGSEARLHVSRTQFPEPPAGLLVTPDVESMYTRYAEHLQGREYLGQMAYFCLTVVLATGPGTKAAAKHLDVSRDVLRMLGELTSTAGGSEARKAEGVDSDYTSKQRAWIEQAVKLLIRRMGERAAAPPGPLPKITMADLPDL